MGYQLWISPVTGHRRKGTRFSVLRKLFIDNITSRSIYEPLLCCPADSPAESASEALRVRDFDVAGVKETEGGEVIGYVVTDELGVGELRKYVKKISTDLLISDSTPIADLFSVITEMNFVFVISGKHISGIVTKADINKPPVRIYLFGMISLFEMHLGLWVNYYYKKNSWIKKVPKQRMKDAFEIYDLGKMENQELTILECLQLCDKRELLANSNQFMEEFYFSKRSFNSYVKRVEKVRNGLAHSQYSITANVVWSNLKELISLTESFLINSDNKLERIIAEGNEFQDLLVPSV